MILMAGPTFDNSGYANAFRSMTKLMAKVGCDIKIFADNGWSRLGPKLNKEDYLFFKERTKAFGNKGTGLYQMQKNSFSAFIGYNIIHSMFETDRVPDSWVEGLNKADATFVPSEFLMDVYASSGVKNLFYMPFPIDTEAYNPDVLKLINDKRFKFLFIGDRSPRKNLAFLIQCYLNSFRGRDDVVLIILSYTDRSKIAQEQVAFTKIRNDCMGGSLNPEVILIPNIIPESSLPGLINSCDCYINPSHGEGFGIPSLCAMACEKVTISVSWSSCSDYMQMDCSLPLQYDITPVSYEVLKDNQNFYGHNWANPSYEHLSNLLPYVVENYSMLSDLRKAARKLVIDKYSIPVVANRMKKFLDERGIL